MHFLQEITPATHLSIIILIATVASYLSWRIKTPSILVFLIFGFIAGPAFSVISPRELFGPSFQPLISLSIALILFEGGLSLKLQELRASGIAVRRLITHGLIIGFVINFFFAFTLLDLSYGVAALIAALLIVTGPTVIIPLVRHVRPKRSLGTTLRWEGILTDPVGAILAVLIFETLIVSSFSDIALVTIRGTLVSIVVGFTIATLAARIISSFLKDPSLPENLETPLAFSIVLLAYSLSEVFQKDTGLLTVTLMGIILANTKNLPIRHILEFKENLRAILIPFVFIILGADVSRAQLESIDNKTVLFVVALVFISRPLQVFLSMLNTDIPTKDRLFLAFVAPRGIVATAVSALLGAEMTAHLIPGAERFSATILAVVIGTVTFYSLVSPLVAKALGVASSRHDALVFVGSSPIIMSIASQVKKIGARVLMVDSNLEHTQEAQKKGLETVWGSFADEEIKDKIEDFIPSSVIAATPNSKINALVESELREIVGRQQVVSILPSHRDKNLTSKLDTSQFGSRPIDIDTMKLLNEADITLHEFATPRSIQEVIKEVGVVLLMKTKNADILPCNVATMRAYPYCTAVVAVQGDIAKLDSSGY